jgi:hypothetical protein
MKLKKYLIALFQLNYSITGVDRRLVIQVVKAPRLSRQYMKVLRFSALGTDSLQQHPPPPKEKSLALIDVRNRDDIRAGRIKSIRIPSGIRRETSRRFSGL